MNLVSTNLDLGDALVVPIDPSAYSAVFIAIGGIAFVSFIYVKRKKGGRRRAN